MPALHDSLTFILVRTQFAANLGSAARVIANMGFSQLLLVRPQCDVGAEARTRAMKGAPLLDHALLYPSLAEASREVDLLVGTSGLLRSRKDQWSDCRRFAEEVLPRHLPARVGIAFGSEENGLDREEIDLCRWLIEIPTGSDYRSLNLAQAVAIVAYEVHLALAGPEKAAGPNRADHQHVEGLLRDAEATFRELGLDTTAPLERVMDRLRRIAARAQLQVEDVNLFRGLLRQLRRPPGAG